MILRNQAFVFLILVTLLIAVGCQGGGNPSVPDAPDDNQALTPTEQSVRETLGNRGGHHLLALVECTFDVETGTIDVNPLRSSAQHIDLIQLIPIYCHPASACLDFVNLVIDEPNITIDLDLVVNHPIPFEMADCFDMRGIGIFKGNLSGGFSGGLIADQIQNADGYTTNYDQAGYYNAYLNPFVAFNKDLPNRIFEHLTETTAHVTAKFPSFDPEDSKFLYALDASWQDPELIDPEDPLTDPNLPEPYQVNILYADPISDQYLDEGTVIVEAYDWQDNAAEAELQVPALYGGIVAMNMVWSNEGRFLYYLNIVNDSAATADNYPLLVKVNDEFETQQDIVNPSIILHLDSYQLGNVEIYDSEANTAPLASVVTSDLIIRAGENVHFDASSSSDAEDGTVTSYFWDLDGNGVFDNGTGPEADQSYPELGSYPVNFYVEDSMGLTDVLDNPVIVNVTPADNTRPEASATASKNNPMIDEEITLDGSGSTDIEDGKPVSWEWDLDGDGEYDDASGEIITASWSTTGQRLVDLLVKDSSGLGDTLDEKLTINVLSDENQPPVAIAVADKHDVEVGEEVTFDGTDSYDPEDGDVEQYMWDLNGDGTYGEGHQGIVYYTFWNPGTYEVDLKVKDSEGLEDTLDDPLIINVTGTPNEPPVAVANADKEIVNIEEVVHFDATDSYDPEDGEVHNFAWDLDGDGLYIDAFFGEIDWYYDVPGLYQVDVRVCDIPGLCDTLDDKILIQVLEGGNQPPVAVAVANKTYCFEGETIEFDGSQSTDPEDGFPSSWAWDLDEDGEYDDGPFILVSKQYNTEGTYTVDLKVTDSESAFDTLDELITITVMPPGSNFPPEASAYVNCSFPLLSQEIEFTDESMDFDGDIVKWEWNFNDGSGWHDYTSTQGNVTWSYTEEGIYNADLRVTDNMDATDQLDSPITIYASEPNFPVPSGSPSCGAADTHSFTAYNQLSLINTSASTRDIAFLSSGFLLMVVSNNLIQTDLISIVDPPVMTGADWIQSIDTTQSDFVALSGLTDGLIEVYTAQGVAQDMEFISVADVDVGQPVSAITFDEMSNLWVYTQGQIRAYITPNYNLDPCRIFDVPDIETLGTVHDMDFNIWNHSLYLAIDDGANGTVAEVDYLGNIAGSVSNVLLGPSRYFDIVIDKNVIDSNAPGCRIVVGGGISEGFMTRLDADMTILAQASYGYWGLRSIALDKGPSNIIVGIEDCCVGWVDSFEPPRDWTDID